MSTHDLKVWPAYFKDLHVGGKNFEVRKDDRIPSFKSGDTLLLREWDERSGYTGRETRRRVTYVMPGDQFGIEAGYVVMSLAPMPVGDWWDERAALAAPSTPGEEG